MALSEEQDLHSPVSEDVTVANSVKMMLSVSVTAGTTTSTREVLVEVRETVIIDPSVSEASTMEVLVTVATGLRVTEA
jgi:hypothetical protein